MTVNLTTTDVSDMVYETALTFKGSPFRAVEFSLKFREKFPFDVGALIDAVGKPDCFDTPTLLLNYSKLITKIGRRLYSAEWLPTYEPKYFSRVEIEPENPNYDIFIVGETSNAVRTDYAAFLKVSDEKELIEAFLSIPTSAPTVKDDVVLKAAVENSPVLKDALTTSPPILVQVPNAKAVKEDEDILKRSNCILNIENAPELNLPMDVDSSSQEPIVEITSLQTPHAEVAKNIEPKLSEFDLNVKKGLEVNNSMEVGLNRSVPIPKDTPLAIINKNVAAVKKERTLPKPSESTLNRNTTKERKQGCPLVTAGRVVYTGPKRFDDNVNPTIMVSSRCRSPRRRATREVRDRSSSILRRDRRARERSRERRRSPRPIRYSRSRSPRRPNYYSRDRFDRNRPPRPFVSPPRHRSRSRSRSSRRYKRPSESIRPWSSGSRSPITSGSSQESSKAPTHEEKAESLKKKILGMFSNPAPIVRERRRVETKPIAFAAIRDRQ